MYQIPYVFEPEENELLYSYIIRLARANDPDIKSFFEHFKLAKHGFFEDHNRHKIGNEGVLLPFFGALPPSVSVIRLLSEHTVFPYTFAFFSSQMQAEFLSMVFDALYSPTAKYKRSSFQRIITKAKICPICISKTPVLLVEHHLPGVTACYKHRLRLYEYALRRKINGDGELLPQCIPEPEMCTDAEFLFAEFAYHLWQARPDTNLSQIAQILKERLAEFHISSSDSSLDEMIDFLHLHEVDIDECVLSECISLFFQQGKYIYKGFSTQIDKLAILLFACFLDINEVPFPTVSVHPPKRDVDQISDDFSLQGWTSYAVCLKHRRCGREFAMHPVLFLHNQKCPYCDKTQYTKNEIKRILATKEKQLDFIREQKGMQDLVGDEYTLLSIEWKRGVRWYRIRHNTCQTDYKTTKAHFLAGHRCPHCSKTASTRVSDAEFPNWVNKASNGRYSIGERVGNQRYEITDHQTEITQVLLKQKIIQELTRPTPSKILPLE